MLIALINIYPDQGIDGELCKLSVVRESEIGSVVHVRDEALGDSAKTAFYEDTREHICSIPKQVPSRQGEGSRSVACRLVVPKALSLVQTLRTSSASTT